MANAGKESLKKHGDEREYAMKDADRHIAGTSSLETSPDTIPMPENGGHEKSHAAHLGGPVHDHTKPQRSLRQGTSGSELREPPIVVQRVGKQHR